MTDEDVMGLLLSWLRAPEYGRWDAGGCEIHLPNLVRHHFGKHGKDKYEVAALLKDISSPLYDAAWELCRRGILRPGPIRYETVSSNPGVAEGFTVTRYGRSWLEESDHGLFLPIEPSRYQSMLVPFRERFGPGFYQRAGEAYRAFQANAHLSAVVMCGAASESILLAASIAKKGDEGAILAMYKASGGRSKVERYLFGQVPEQVRSQYRAHSSLLQYWRDESAHGTATNISANEAYTCLLQVLRLSHFISDQWQALTSPA